MLCIYLNSERGRKKHAYIKSLSMSSLSSILKFRSTYILHLWSSPGFSPAFHKDRFFWAVAAASETVTQQQHFWQVAWCKISYSSSDSFLTSSRMLWLKFTHYICKDRLFAVNVDKLHWSCNAQSNYSLPRNKMFGLWKVYSGMSSFIKKEFCISIPRNLFSKFYCSDFSLLTFSTVRSLLIIF